MLQVVLYSNDRFVKGKIGHYCLMYIGYHGNEESGYTIWELFICNEKILLEQVQFVRSILKIPQLHLIVLFSVSMWVINKFLLMAGMEICQSKPAFISLNPL